MNALENKLKNEIVYNMSPQLRSIVSAIELGNVQEIRIRAGKPLMISKNGNNLFVNKKGELTKNERDYFNVSRDELIKTLELVYKENYKLLKTLT